MSTSTTSTSSARNMFTTTSVMWEDTSDTVSYTSLTAVTDNNTMDTTYLAGTTDNLTGPFSTSSLAVSTSGGSTMQPLLRLTTGNQINDVTTVSTSINEVNLALIATSVSLAVLSLVLIIVLLIACTRCCNKQTVSENQPQNAESRLEPDGKENSLARKPEEEERSDKNCSYKRDILHPDPADPHFRRAEQSEIYCNIPSIYNQGTRPVPFGDSYGQHVKVENETVDYARQKRDGQYRKNPNVDREYHARYAPSGKYESKITGYPNYESTAREPSGKYESKIPVFPEEIQEADHKRNCYHHHDSYNRAQSGKYESKLPITSEETQEGIDNIQLYDNVTPLTQHHQVGTDDQRRMNQETDRLYVNTRGILSGQYSRNAAKKSAPPVPKRPVSIRKSLKELFRNSIFTRRKKAVDEVDEVKIGEDNPYDNAMPGTSSQNHDDGVGNYPSRHGQHSFDEPINNVMPGTSFQNYNVGVRNFPSPQCHQPFDEPGNELSKNEVFLKRKERVEGGTMASGNNKPENIRSDMPKSHNNDLDVISPDVIEKDKKSKKKVITGGAPNIPVAKQQEKTPAKSELQDNTLFKRRQKKVASNTHEVKNQSFGNGSESSDSEYNDVIGPQNVATYDDTTVSPPYSRDSSSISEGGEYEDITPGEILPPVKETQRPPLTEYKGQNQEDKYKEKRNRDSWRVSKSSLYKEAGSTELITQQFEWTDQALVTPDMIRKPKPMASKIGFSYTTPTFS